MTDPNTIIHPPAIDPNAPPAGSPQDVLASAERRTGEEEIEYRALMAFEVLLRRLPVDLLAVLGELLEAVNSTSDTTFADRAELVREGMKRAELPGGLDAMLLRAFGGNDQADGRELEQASTDLPPELEQRQPGAPDASGWR